MLSIRPRTLATLTAILALSFASGCFGHVRTRRAVYVQPGVTASVSTAPVAQGVVVYQAPPARRATVAVRPAAPVSGAVWVQGQWQWNGAQYVWTEGYWLQPRAGSVYVQPRWQRRGRGYVYVQGAWRGNGRGRAVQRRRVNRVQRRRVNRQRGYVRGRGRTGQQRGTVTVQVR